MPAVRAIVREAADERLFVRSDRHGHRQEHAVSHAQRARNGADATVAADERRGCRPVAGGSGELACSSRRSTCRDARSCGQAARAIGLPLLERDGARRHRARADGRGAAKPRMGFFYLPHGAIMNNTRFGAEMNRWTPDTSRPRLRLEADPRAVRAAQEVHDRRQRSRQQAGRELRGARDLPGDVADRACTPRQVTAPQRRRHGRPDRGAPHRPGDAAAVARARDGRGRRRRGVRRHLRLQLQPHDLVPHADDAAADGVRSRARRSRRSSAAATPTRSAARSRASTEPARHGDGRGRAI